MGMTKEQFDLQVKHLGVNLLFKKREFSTLRETLSQGESLRELFEGHFQGIGSLIALTNARLLIVRGKNVINQIPLEDVDSAEGLPALVLGVVSINARGVRYRIENVQKSLVNQLAKAIIDASEQRKADGVLSETSANDSPPSTLDDDWSPAKEQAKPQKRKGAKLKTALVVVAGLILIANIAGKNKEGAKIESKSTAGGAQVSVDLNSGKEFKPVYEGLEISDLSSAKIVRKRQNIVVPLGLSKQELEKNLSHAAWALQRKYNANAVAIFAYREDDKQRDVYSAGKCDLAPYGEWSRAGENVSASDMKVKMEIADGYFSTQSKLSPGNKAKLTKENAILSNSAKAWGDENIVSRLKKNTEVVVVEIAEFPYPGGTTVRYKVKTTAGQIGWVHGSDLKGL